MNKNALALAVSGLVLTAPVFASADESGDALFEEGVAALEKGAFDDAIDRFELLADRGVTHPDADFDRALAYIRRAKTPGARPGDLGRAAAALEEALLYRPDDAEARFALDRVHEEITHRRSRAHARDVERKPSLGWAVVGLFTEDTWTKLALLASFVLTGSFVVRFLGKSHASRLASAVSASLSAIVLVIAGGLGALARWDRTESNLGVVIVEEAHLLDENGAPIRGSTSGGAPVIPEGALVRVEKANASANASAKTGQASSLTRVEWGTLNGRVSGGQVRILSRP